MVLKCDGCLRYPTIKELAKLCYEKFKTLPKTGKPCQNEWSIYSAIVQFNSISDDSKVVALGCGTKCLGGKQLCSKGLSLSDSHAEVIARRSFLRYLYYNLKLFKNIEETDDCILVFNEETKKFHIKSEISFHFLSTATPCGDACIIEDFESKNKIRKLNDDFGAQSKEELKDTIYTGAKLIGNSDIDGMLQDIGAIRIKPGKGDRTLSVSCSDKLSKWNILGIQGALLDIFFQKPIYFATLNFCCDSNKDSIERAIYKRFSKQKWSSTRFLPQKPPIRIDDQFLFEFCESRDRSNPTANGIAWSCIDETSRPFEVIVKGKKLGITKKLKDSPKGAALISKYHLMNQFLEVLQHYPSIKRNLKINQDVASSSYLELKHLSEDYQKAWFVLKKEYFKQWSEKPETLLQFRILIKS